jgi:hypothetical protein
MSDKLSSTLSTLPILTPKAEVIELSIVHDIPLVDPLTDLGKVIHNQVELEPQDVSDQFRSLPNMVEEDISKHEITNANMSAPKIEIVDYTVHRMKSKVEPIKPETVRIPISLIKRMSKMIYERTLIDDLPFTRQDLYCQAIARYLENEGY